MATVRAREVGIVLSTLRSRLRDQTEQAHTQVEAQLALLDPDLTAARVTGAVCSLYGFWAGNEPAIENWFTDHRGAAARLDWSRRRRTSCFAHDLTSLGLSPAAQLEVPRAPPVFTVIGSAQVYGWLYVAEGSTLGGAVIARHLERLQLDLPDLRGFTPYLEGPGPMWRSFELSLEHWGSGRADRADAISAAAVATFEALSGWLADLAVPVSA